MKNNIFNLKSVLSLSLVLILMLSFASCSTRNNDTAFLDQISEAEAYSEEEVSVEESSEPPTEDGYTARPIVTHVKNSTPYSVVVAGTCEEGSVVKAYNVASTNEVYETKAIGNYFIMEIKLSGTNEHYYEISATVEGKKESTVNYFNAKYDAVAEKPLNGTAVTIGNDSSLFYDSLISTYKGDSLLTNTELKAFEDKLKSNTQNSAIKYVYVMIPGMLSVYNERVPESISKDSYNTKFSQISNVISKTNNADVIDLTEAFVANKDKDHPLYYNTSSNLSDFGSYIAYQEIIKYISNDFKSITATEYDFETINGKGGDLVTSIQLDTSVFNETYHYLKNSATTIPDGSEMTCPISDIVVYADKESNVLYTDTADEAVTGAGETIFFKTNRAELPSAVIIRDDSANALTTMLAENFNNSYFEANGNMSITTSAITSAVTSYASADKTYVDYVFVIVSENNIDSLING